MTRGNKVILYNGYTFYQKYKKVGGKRWICTSYPSCKSSIIVERDMFVSAMNAEHSHPRKSLILTESGRYVKTWVNVDYNFDIQV